MERVFAFISAKRLPAELICVTIDKAIKRVTAVAGGKRVSEIAPIAEKPNPERPLVSPEMKKIAAKTKRTLVSIRSYQYFENQCMQTPSGIWAKRANRYSGAVNCVRPDRLLVNASHCEISEGVALHAVP